MSASGGARDRITVTGGRGGVAVALDDLTRAVVELTTAAEALGSAAHRARRLDLWAVEVLLAGSDAVALLGRVEWQRSSLVGILRSAAGGLDDLAWRTRLAVTGYRVAEEEAALAARLARASVVTVSRGLQTVGDPAGLLRDGRPAPAVPVPVDAESRIEIHDLASVLTSQSLLSGHPVVRVIEIPQPDGASAWVLQIPGTQVWHPRAGPVAHDLTSDVRLMGHETGVLTRAALDALGQAQAHSGRLDRDDPVMVTGHSLGGIAAMSIGADPTARERFRITHVVTAGAPVGHFTAPDDLVVLSLEHADDVVPRADLTANPDRPNWTTVRREVPGGRMLLPGSGPSEHGALTYRETARLAAVAAATGSHSSLAAWSASAAPFFVRSSVGSPGAGPGQRVRDYRVARVTQSRS